MTWYFNQYFRLQMTALGLYLYCGRILILDSTLILMDILDNLVVITAFISSYDNVDLAVNMTYIMCISLEQQI